MRFNVLAVMRVSTIVVLQATFVVSTEAVAGGSQGEDPLLAVARLVPHAVHGVLLDGASAGDRMVVVGEHGVILVSDDHGSSWRQADVPVQVTLTGVEFEGSAQGWAVGHDATILHTENGGDSWTVQYFSPELKSPLLDVWFDGPKRGIAIGGNGVLLSTEDGGRKWRKVILSLSDGFRPHLFKLTGSGSALYIAAEEGTLFKSTDLGESWFQLKSPYEGSFFGVAEPFGTRDSRVIAYGMLGHIFFSEGGDKWLRVDNSAQESLLDHGTVGDGVLILAGLSGCVLVSHDSGRSFERADAGTTMDISAVLPIPGQPSSALLLGSRGVVPFRIPAAHGGRAP